MIKYKHSDLLVAYKGKLMQVERSHGDIVFLISNRGMYGIAKEVAKRFLVRKAYNIDIGFKLNPVTKIN
jgi:hypothetical protein